MSVKSGPADRFRHWCSFRYLRILPLHRKFHLPLPPSSSGVSKGLPGLGPGLSPWTSEAACVRFTPSDSGQRSQPTYYRGCWHVVSRCLFLKYRRVSSLRKEVYDPKAFIPHAALLCQGFPHCTRSLTAASRRSLGRVSVPVWLAILSDQLRIVALVGHYPTNKLIRRRPLPKRLATLITGMNRWSHAVLALLSESCPPLRGRSPTCYSAVRH